MHLTIHPSVVVGRTWWGVLLGSWFQWGLLRWGPLGFVVVGPGMLWSFAPPRLWLWLRWVLADPCLSLDLPLAGAQPLVAPHLAGGGI